MSLELSIEGTEGLDLEEKIAFDTGKNMFQDNNQEFSKIILGTGTSYEAETRYISLGGNLYRPDDYLSIVSEQKGVVKIFSYDISLAVMITDNGKIEKNTTLSPGQQVLYKIIGYSPKPYKLKISLAKQP